MNLKCPHCQQYSLTYDYERHGFICHVYNGFIPCEHIPGAELWAWVDDVLDGLWKALGSIVGVDLSDWRQQCQ